MINLAAKAVVNPYFIGYVGGKILESKVRSLFRGEQQKLNQTNLDYTQSLKPQDRMLLIDFIAGTHGITQQQKSDDTANFIVLMNNTCLLNELLSNKQFNIKNLETETKVNTLRSQLNIYADIVKKAKFALTYNLNDFNEVDHLKQSQEIRSTILKLIIDILSDKQIFIPSRQGSTQEYAQSILNLMADLPRLQDMEFKKSYLNFLTYGVIEPKYTTLVDEKTQQIINTRNFFDIIQSDELKEYLLSGAIHKHKHTDSGYFFGKGTKLLTNSSVDAAKLLLFDDYNDFKNCTLHCAIDQLGHILTDKPVLFQKYKAELCLLLGNELYTETHLCDVLQNCYNSCTDTNHRLQINFLIKTIKNITHTMKGEEKTYEFKEVSEQQISAMQTNELQDISQQQTGKLKNIPQKQIQNIQNPKFYYCNHSNTYYYYHENKLSLLNVIVDKRGTLNVPHSAIKQFNDQDNNLGIGFESKFTSKHTNGRKQGKVLQEDIKQANSFHGDKSQISTTKIAQKIQNNNEKSLVIKTIYEMGCIRDISGFATIHNRGKNFANQTKILKQDLIDNQNKLIDIIDTNKTLLKNIENNLQILLSNDIITKVMQDWVVYYNDIYNQPNMNDIKMHYKRLIPPIKFVNEHSGLQNQSQEIKNIFIDLIKTFPNQILQKDIVNNQEVLVNQAISLVNSKMKIVEQELISTQTQIANIDKEKDELVKQQSILNEVIESIIDNLALGQQNKEAQELREIFTDPKKFQSFIDRLITQMDDGLFIDYASNLFPKNIIDSNEKSGYAKSIFNSIMNYIYNKQEVITDAQIKNMHNFQHKFKSLVAQLDTSTEHFIKIDKKLTEQRATINKSIKNAMQLEGEIRDINNINAAFITQLKDTHIKLTEQYKTIMHELIEQNAVAIITIGKDMLIPLGIINIDQSSFNHLIDLLELYNQDLPKFKTVAFILDRVYNQHKGTIFGRVETIVKNIKKISINTGDCKQLQKNQDKIMELLKQDAGLIDDNEKIVKLHSNTAKLFNQLVQGIDNNQQDNNQLLSLPNKQYFDDTKNALNNSLDDLHNVFIFNNKEINNIQDKIKPNDMFTTLIKNLTSDLEVKKIAINKKIEEIKALQKACESNEYLSLDEKNIFKAINEMSIQELSDQKTIIDNNIESLAIIANKDERSALNQVINNAHKLIITDLMKQDIAQLNSFLNTQHDNNDLQEQAFGYMGMFRRAIYVVCARIPDIINRQIENAVNNNKIQQSRDANKVAEINTQAKQNINIEQINKYKNYNKIIQEFLSLQTEIFTIVTIAGKEIEQLKLDNKDCKKQEDAMQNIILNYGKIAQARIQIETNIKTHDMFTYLDNFNKQFTTFKTNYSTQLMAAKLSGQYVLNNAIILQIKLDEFKQAVSLKTIQNGVYAIDGVNYIVENHVILGNNDKQEESIFQSFMQSQIKNN